MPNKKILYIAGYSRSGSTILDIILGSHKNFFGTGELVYLFDDWLNGARLCTCGKRYQDCDFWKNFQLPAGMDFKEAIKTIRAVESRSSVNDLISGKIEKSIIEKYTLIQTALFEYIFSISGKSVIIDSSKSSRDMAGRFYALNKYTDYDVYVIHLIKDGVSIVKSYVEKGRNWAMEGHAKNDRFLAARSSFGWLLANKNAKLLGEKLKAGSYLPLHYEELVSDPASFLNKAGAFINEDFTEVLETIKSSGSFFAGHNVGGNRLRLEKEIKLLPPSGLKSTKLDVISRLTFQVIAGKLNKYFGY